MAELNFVVESGVPVPACNKLVLELRKLEIGQSVHVLGKTVREIAHHIRRAKGSGKYFESKTLTTGVRVWRLE